MFASLIHDTAQRFQLSESNAGRLVRMISDALFDSSQGGFSGMRERFNGAGLGDLFSSWIGITPGDAALQPQQFEAGFGQQNVQRITRALNLPESAVAAAGAWLLPKIVGMVTRGGAIPSARPADYDRLFSTAVPPADIPTPVAAATATARSQPATPVATSGGGWWKWLLGVAVLVGAFLLYRGCQHEPAAPMEPALAPTTAAQPAQTAEKSNALFDFANDSGKVTISGRLPSVADKKTLMDALGATFGVANLSGTIEANPNTLPANWLKELTTALPELKDPGLKFKFDGDKLTVDTSALPEDRRFAISDKLRLLLGNFQIEGLWDRAAAAFAGLKAGFSSSDLVKALNLMRVHFDTGSATITRDSQETLTAAANAIKQAPAGTRIEVGGHTDNTGDAAANQTLSQQRADAVMARLNELGVAGDVLTAKGYGQTKPIADNATEEGKASNRRIEFSVSK